MKYYLAAFVIIIGLGSAGHSQATRNENLVLTGTFINVKQKFDFEPFRENQDLAAAKQAEGKGEHYVFEVQLFLQFRNNMNLPLIIFLPSQFYGKSTIEFLESAESNSVKSSAEIPWKDYYRSIDYDPIPSFLRELEGPEPKKHRFVIIEPEGYFEYNQTFTVRKGYKFPSFQRFG
jgi:hypothetical protein